MVRPYRSAPAARGGPPPAAEPAGARGSRFVRIRVAAESVRGRGPMSAKRSRIPGAAASSGPAMR